MRTTTVARKPCGEGTAVGNVLRHAAGALNIGGCRIGTTKNVPASPSRTRGNALSGSVDGSLRRETGDEDGHNPNVGRWPANVVVVHRGGCRRAGTAAAPGRTINRWKDGAKPFGGGAGHEYESEQLPEETVDVWECASGCPVGSLGEQSGRQVSGRHGAAPGGFGAAALYGDGSRSLDVSGGYDDSGTAARYFKQTQEKDMAQIPDELWDYLTTMISPPADCDPVLIVTDDMGDVDWDSYADASVHGMVVVGNPGPHMERIDRVLKPGAHLLVIAPDDEPTGHTGACAVEDYGFEIRDAIALLDRPDDFHYVAKASSSERNAGLPDFETKIEVERAFPREGVNLEELYEQISAAVDERWLENWEEEGVPPAEVPDVVMEGFEIRKVEDTRTHRNNHPTVKAVGVMERLLRDVPRDAGPVVDPFMGSGTTGVACLKTGHDFIGIEQDPDYIKIADQRVRHWDRAIAAWNGAEITSEAKIEEDEEPVSLEDFFGG